MDHPGWGFFIWLTLLPKSIPDACFLRSGASSTGVRLFRRAGGIKLRLSYSFVEDDVIEPGIRIMAKMPRRFARGSLISRANQSNRYWSAWRKEQPAA